MESRLDDTYRGRDVEKSQAMALFYATNTRLKFDRVYKSARKAILAGDVPTAIVKCRAALDLLDERDIYGESQPALRQLIEEQLERMVNRPAPQPAAVDNYGMSAGAEEPEQDEPARVAI